MVFQMDFGFLFGVVFKVNGIAAIFGLFLLLVFRQGGYSSQNLSSASAAQDKGMGKFRVLFCSSKIAWSFSG